MTGNNWIWRDYWGISAESCFASKSEPAIWRVMEEFYSMVGYEMQSRAFAILTFWESCTSLSGYDGNSKMLK